MAVVRVDNQFQILSPDTKLEAVRVTDIILDPSHDRFEDFGNYDSIGTVFYTKLNQSNPSTDSIARPLFSFVKNYPLINEVVLIMSSGDKDNKISTYYFPLVNIWNHPHHNALPYVEDIQSTTNDYEQSIARQVEDGSTGIELGTYFSESLDIRPLLPYEGDTIIEGRFGNSIRFGSTNISDKVGTPNEWSNVGKLSDPITIIRNGQSDNLEKKGWIHAKEDIMGDASSIYMTSNQQLSNFTPSSLNQKSFGANLVEVPTIQEQLTGDYITPETLITQPEQTTEDIPEETTESFETTPPPPVPQESESDDPFADYAEEILDGAGDIEILDISGTEEEEENTTNQEISSSPESISINEISLNTPIPSSQYSGKSTIVHTPLSVTDIKNQITLDETSNRVKYLVVHTTASPKTFSVNPHLAIAYYFMQNKGWTKGGYHITIDYEGTCVQMLKDGISSNGVNGAGKGLNKSSDVGNNNTINISWIGGKGAFDMTKDQANSLNELVKYYILRYPNIKVLGHNQIAAKSCPWFDVREYCKELGISSNNIDQRLASGMDLSKEKYNNHTKIAKLTM
tara:strand:+ start:39 stop:1748 length:1710 start_codon:yes stop_codon:yes gene_type:complete